MIATLNTLKSSDSSVISKDTVSTSSSYREYIARGDYSTAIERSVAAEMKGDELFKLGKKDLAQRYYNKTTAIEEAILGKDHPVVKSFHEKVTCDDDECWQRSALRKAMQVLYQGLQIEKKGDRLLKLGKKDLAKVQFENAFKIEETILGEHHPMTQSLREKIILSTN